MARPARLYHAGIICTLLTTLAACGYTDPGTGSHTLQVDGSVSYNPTRGSDKSVLNLTVRKAGVALTNAIVQVIDGDTGESTSILASGTSYTGTWAGYHRRVAFRIISGDDSVTCRLEGPGRHTVSTPAHASVHKLGDPLHVAWSTADGVRGEEVTLRLTPGHYSATLGDDDGHVRIGSPDLQPGLTTLSVLRRTRVVPAGAVAPSQLIYDYEVQNDFVIH